MSASKKSTYVVVNLRFGEDKKNPIHICFWPVTGDETQFHTHNKAVAYKLRDKMQKKFPETPYEVAKIEYI